MRNDRDGGSYDRKMRAITIALIVMALASAPRALAETVQYRVTLGATWSNSTHPGAWLVSSHFSPLIGGTHNSSVSFWQPGSLSSAGIQNMAERGQISPLDAEIQSAITAGTADSVFSGPAVDSPGSTSLLFDVNDQFPLVTLVTMIAPSPDWFVGVHGLALFENGAWHETVVVSLLPYDAGTDSGASFISPDQATFPRVPIQQITGAPFGGTPPLGTFTFQLVPEPSALALAAFGIVVAALFGRQFGPIRRSV